MPGRFLSVLHPLARVMPEVKVPEKRVSFNEKLLWTGLALIAYFIMSEIPIFGAVRAQGDPYYYLRVIFASSRGSLMELGIQPIVTSGIITQLLATSGIIGYDNKSEEDRYLIKRSFDHILSLLVNIGKELPTDSSLLNFSVRNDTL